MGSRGCADEGDGGVCGCGCLLPVGVPVPVLVLVAVLVVCTGAESATTDDGSGSDTVVVVVMMAVLAEWMAGEASTSSASYEGIARRLIDGQHVQQTGGRLRSGYER